MSENRKNHPPPPGYWGPKGPPGGKPPAQPKSAPSAGHAPPPIYWGANSPSAGKPSVQAKSAAPIGHAPPPVYGRTNGPSSGLINKHTLIQPARASTRVETDWNKLENVGDEFTGSDLPLLLEIVKKNASREFELQLTMFNQWLIIAGNFRGSFDALYKEINSPSGRLENIFRAHVSQSKIYADVFAKLKKYAFIHLLSANACAKELLKTPTSRGLIFLDGYSSSGAIHAEQHILYMFAKMLAGGYRGGAPTFIVGVKHPCTYCRHMLYAFSRAYKEAYGKYLRFVEGDNIAPSSGANTVTAMILGIKSKVPSFEHFKLALKEASESKELPGTTAKFKGETKVTHA